VKLTCRNRISPAGWGFGEPKTRAGYASSRRWWLDAAGNRLLNGVGQAITREKRDADIAARFGGEEFAVLVPGRAADGMIVAERMRRAISDLTPAPTSQRDFAPSISASAGIASFPVDARTPQELFELADRALYEAKRRGRDQVVVVGDIVEPPLRLARTS